VVSKERVRRPPRREGRSRRREDGGAKGKRLAAGAAVVTCLGLLAVVVYASVTSTAWRLGGYTVRGASYLTAQEVLAAAGFEGGDNLFWMDLERVERNLCRHPRIRHAEVRRRLPAEVVITVEERPAAAALIVNGELWKVSADGVVLGVRYRATGEIRGKRLNGNEIDESLAALEGLGQVDPAWTAAVDYVDVEERVVVLAAGRYSVKYGPGFEERTARRLKRVFEATRVKSRSGVTYDCRFGADVIVTGTAAAGGGEAGGDTADDGEV
jgi:cell division septal protein FtsQ